MKMTRVYEWRNNPEIDIMENLTGSEKPSIKQLQIMEDLMVMVRITVLVRNGQ